MPYLKRADFPATQPTKHELVINQAAKALGLGLPTRLLA
jgi:hypothetical protein